MRLYSSQKHLRILRPLLMMPKSRISQYLQDNALSYVSDPSNLQTHFTRNKLDISYYQQSHSNGHLHAVSLLELLLLCSQI